jgi:hypothetical protein
MGTASASSAIDARLIRILVNMAMHVLAEAPGSVASDAAAPDTRPSARPPEGAA